MARHPLLRVILLISLLTGPAGAASDEGELAVFVGLDLMVGEGENAHPIHHVDRGTAVVKVFGELQQVPLRGLKAFQTKRSAKVGRRALTLSKLEITRAHGSMDPLLEEMANQGRLTALSMEVKDAAEREMINAGALASSIELRNEPDAARQAAAVRASAMDRYTRANDMADRISDSRHFSDQYLEASKRDRHDAISVKFRVESKEPIPEAYVVIVAEVFDPIRPAEPRTLVHLRDIGALEPGGKTVRIFQGGFPPGYQLLGSRLHVFSRGQELGTNLSEKSVSLAPDELREYLKLERTGAAGGRFHPEPVWATAPAGFLSSLTPADTAATIELTVDAEGRVTSLEAEGLSRWARDVLHQLVFRPALENGQPVAGRLAGRLAEFLP